MVILVTTCYYLLILANNSNISYLYLDLVQRYPVKMKSVVFHVRRMAREQLTRLARHLVLSNPEPLSYPLFLIPSSLFFISCIYLLFVLLILVSYSFFFLCLLFPIPCFLFLLFCVFLLDRYQLMEDCIGCRSPDEVREVVLQAVRYEELGTYVFDPYKVVA